MPGFVSWILRSIIADNNYPSLSWSCNEGDTEMEQILRYTRIEGIG